jgi:hypothetical protein
MENNSKNNEEGEVGVNNGVVKNKYTGIMGHTKEMASEKIQAMTFLERVAGFQDEVVFAMNKYGCVPQSDAMNIMDGWAEAPIQSAGPVITEETVKTEPVSEADNTETDQELTK